MGWSDAVDAMGGLMSDPNKAGLMGLAQGLLAASGPSRLPISMGQAMASGLQGYQQGRMGSMQAQHEGIQNQLDQYNLKRQQIVMQAMDEYQRQTAGGGQPVAGGQPSQPAIPPSPGGLLGSGTAGIPVGGQDASGSPQPMLAPPQAGQPTGGLMGPAPTSPGIPQPSLGGHTPAQMFQMGQLLAMNNNPNGATMMQIAVAHDPQLALQMPNDAMRTAAAAYGYGTPQYQAALKAQADKAGYIAPTALRTPLYFDPVTGTTKVVPPDQISAAYGGQAEAQARGKGNIDTQKVWDPTANAGRGGFVFQTQSQIADAATGGAPVAPGAPVSPGGPTQTGAPGMPAPMRNNNPGALMPHGQMAQFPTPEAGLQALDANLANYGKQGVTTLRGVISKWAPPNENNTDAYIKDVSQRLSLNPDQPIDLSNPMVRHAIGAQIVLHENGPSNVFAAPRKQGPMAAEPPLGQTSSQNASQTAPSEQMKKDYETMANAGPQTQQSLEYLDHMLQLAQKKPFYMGMGVGGIPLVDRVSTDAAEYEKARASYISAQGKSLGSSGTDAARGTIEDSVPEYGKPQDAMIRGLTDQRNQLVTGMLRRQFLAPTYQSGDEKSYTSLANGFDQNIKPSMAPVLSMPPGKQQAAVSAAIKADPSTRPYYEWAFNHGLLK